MSVNAASGHVARASLLAAGTGFVNATPDQQPSRSAAPSHVNSHLKESAFVPGPAAAPAADGQTAGRTLDVRL